MNRAVRLMLFSSIMHSLLGVFVKLGAVEIPLMEQIFFRNIPLLLYGYVRLRKSKASLLPKKSNAFLIFIRAVVGFSSMVGLFYANAKLDLSVAQVLYRTSPMWIGLLAVFLLKESYDRNKFIALLLAFIGTLLILRPQGYLGIVPGIIGLYSALAVSVAYISIHLLQDRESPDLILFWFALSCVVLSAVFLPGSFVLPSTKQWIYLFLVALTGGLGQWSVTTAYQLAPAGDIGIYDYFGVLLSPLLGRFIFSENISLMKILGIGFILLAAWFHHGKKFLAKNKDKR